MTILNDGQNSEMYFESDPKNRNRNGAATDSASKENSKSVDANGNNGGENKTKTVNEYLQKLQSVLYNATAVVYIVDPKDRLLLVNREWERLFNSTKDQVAGKSFYEFFPKEIADEFHLNNQKVFETGAPLQVEEKAPHDDGLHTYGTVKFPLFDPDGTIYAICGISSDITASRQAEELIRKSQDRSIQMFQEAERLREFNASTMDARVEGVILEDAEGRIVFINPIAEIILGYDFEDLHGQHWKELTPPDEWDYVANQPPRQDGSEASLYESRLLAKDGSEIPVSISATPFTQSGRFAGIMVTFVDITEQKKNEELLATRARQQAAVAELGQRAIAGTDFSTLMNEAVELVAETLGVEYCKVLEMLPAGDALLLIAGIGWKEGLVERTTVPADRGSQAGFTLLSNEPVVVEDFSEETRFSAPSLLVNHDIISGVSVIIEGTKQPFGVLSAHSAELMEFTEEDISFLRAVANILAHSFERKRSEEKLRESEVRYQEMFENANDIIYTLDLDGNINTINKKGEFLTGYSRAEDMGKSISEIVAPEYLALAIESFTNKLTGEAKTTSYEVEIVCKDGSRLPVEVNSSLIYEKGKPVGVQGIARDISERRRDEAERRKLEGQLLQAQKIESIGRLAGGVAHDFNNLLTAIIGHSELLRWRLGESHPLRGEIEEILKAGNRAASLTGQLLAFSRSQSLVRRTINLNDTLSNLLKMLKRIIGEHVEVQVKTSPDPILIFADAGQIEQVIMNLAINARDAMPGGGQLIIGTRNTVLDEAYCSLHHGAIPGRYAHISVNDTGVGMDADTQRKIFDPFFTTKEIGKGTGLGLAVVHGIVEQHGGSIRVYSEPGLGTTFNIYIPVQEQSAEEESSKVELLPSTGTETILIAEDDETLRNLAKSVLSGLGYKVLLARNGEEAVELYLSNMEQIDLVILDCVMPRMSGREAYENMQKMGGDVPSIFVTGYSAEMPQSQYEPLPGAEIIHKPYGVIELGQKVREVLDENRDE